jgi:uncharacterized membrane protein
LTATTRQRQHIGGMARQHWPFLLLACLGAAYLIATALVNHSNLGTGYDLGIYDQVVWNLSHGRLFETTLVYETQGTYDHFEPVLLLIAPIYRLFSDVRVLLVLQSLALALGAVPIYLYARYRFAQIGVEGLVALLPAVAYLIYPPLHAANLNNFHEVALLPALIGMALYELLTGRRWLMLIFLGLALLVKEDVTVTVLAFGAYIALLKPPGFRRRDGIILAALAIAWGVLVLYVIYPAVTHGMPYPFVGRRYAWLGASPEQAVQGLAANPAVALARILQPPKLNFLFQLFAPLLFLPLLGWPIIALAFPVLVYLMLSDYPPQWSVGSYYNPPLLAFLFFAAIDATAWIVTRVRKWRWSPRPLLVSILGLVLVVVIMDYVISTRGAQSHFFFPAELRPSDRTNAANQIFAQIPPDAAVSTEWDLVPHLSHRQAIYTLLARPVDPPDYLLQEVKETSEGAPIYPWAAPDVWPPVYHEYEPLSRVGPFQLSQLKRTVPLEPIPRIVPTPRPIEPGAYAWLNGDSAEGSLVVQPGDTARLMIGWRRTGNLDRRYVFFVHLLREGGPAADNGLPEILAQSSHEAGDGAYPTTFWQTWTWPSTVLDEQDLVIPTGLQPGTYYAWAGVFDKETGDRLELGGSGKTMRRVATLTVQP